LKKKIIIKVKRVVHRKGDPYFYILWKLLLDGKKFNQHGANFPFSMS